MLQSETRIRNRIWLVWNHNYCNQSVRAVGEKLAGNICVERLIYILLRGVASSAGSHTFFTIMHFSCLTFFHFSRASIFLHSVRMWQNPLFFSPLFSALHHSFVGIVVKFPSPDYLCMSQPLLQQKKFKLNQHYTLRQHVANKQQQCIRYCKHISVLTIVIFFLIMMILQFSQTHCAIAWNMLIYCQRMFNFLWLSLPSDFCLLLASINRLTPVDFTRQALAKSWGKWNTWSHHIGFNVIVTISLFA